MNKKERQRLIREQKQKAAARRDRIRQIGSRVAMVVLVPLLIIGVLYGLLGQGEVPGPAEVTEADHVRGNPEGVTLVVYADFQCPACATEHRVMNQAWPRIRDNAQLVFRHFPLTDTHAHAFTAAAYAEAAGEQGRFWEMHDLLFNNQSYWSGLSRDEAEETFDGYLEQLELDVEQAREDMDSEALLRKIRNDQRGGTRSGVRSTPTLFVDGRQRPVPRSPGGLVDLVEEATAS